jgi:bifunctional Delta-12/omega-3 fatty acid desaturase
MESLTPTSYTTYSRKFQSFGYRCLEIHILILPPRRIPFYYAEEATEALKPILGDLYHREDTFMDKLWSTFNGCRYVEKDPKNPGLMKWAE